MNQDVPADAPGHRACRPLPDPENAVTSHWRRVFDRRIARNGIDARVARLIDPAAFTKQTWQTVEGDEVRIEGADFSSQQRYAQAVAFHRAEDVIAALAKSPDWLAECRLAEKLAWGDLEGSTVGSTIGVETPAEDTASRTGGSGDGG